MLHSSNSGKTKGDSSLQLQCYIMFALNPVFLVRPCAGYSFLVAFHCRESGWEDAITYIGLSQVTNVTDSGHN